MMSKLRTNDLDQFITQENSNPLSNRIRSPRDEAIQITHQRSMSPNQIHPKSRPILTRNGKSPRNPRPTEASKMCRNHPDKKAEYSVIGSNYCNRCAAQMASTGYTVNRIQQPYGTSNTRLNSQRRRLPELPSYPQYEASPIYQEVIDFLKGLNMLQTQINGNIRNFQSLQQHYRGQLDLTAKFYDEIINIITQMKTDHLEDLYEESERNTQIADIRNDHLHDNLLLISTTRDDIESHLQEVMSEIAFTSDQQILAEFRDNFGQYKHSIEMIKLQNEEELQTLSTVTDYKQNQIQQMIQQFEEQLMQLWQDHESQKSTQRNYHIPQSHPIEPQEHYEPEGQSTNITGVKKLHSLFSEVPAAGKTACRNLFEDNEEEEVAASPNFKGI